MLWNLSLDIVQKNQKVPDTSSGRRHSMNLFVRFRINKQDKIAANVAQHIRAVRAAEALDRRTRLKRTDSFSFTGIAPGILPVQRSTSSGEESPGAHDKKRISGIIQQAYTEDVAEEVITRREDVACQTSYDLLEALLPSLRKRIMRSETIMSNLGPDDEDIKYSVVPYKTDSCHHKHPVFGDTCRHFSICGSNYASVNMAYDNTNPTIWGSARPKSRNRHRPADRVEVEYKMAEESELQDYEVEEVLSLREMKRTKALQLLGKKAQYNKLQAVIASATEGTSLSLPQEGVSEASFSPTVSQDSLIDATSSIVEESASTGSDDTPGSAVYKNIIINLGGTQDRSSSRGFLSASQSSATSAANLNILPTITDSRTSHSQENLNESTMRSSPEVTKWHPPKENGKVVATKSNEIQNGDES